MKLSLSPVSAITESENYKWFAYVTIAIGIGMSVIDQSGLNIAIPAISKYFALDIPTIQWIILANILTTSALFLPMGRLADTVGIKKIYLTGFVIFGIGALIAGNATSYNILLFAKIFQGFGTACIQANGMYMATNIFPENERGRALGLYVSIIGMGAILGPVIAGVLIEQFGWRSIFFSSLFVAIVAFLFGLFILKSDDKSFGKKFNFDWTGALISSVALIILLLGVTNIHRYEFLSFESTGAIVLGTILLTVFIIWESKSSNPMLAVHFFKVPQFSLGVVTRLLAFIAFSSTMFLMPFYLIQVLEYKTNVSGLLLISSAFFMAIISPFSGRLSDKFGTKWISMLGIFFIGSASFIFSTLTINSGPLIIIIGLSISGAGWAIFSSPNTSTIMGSLPIENRGVVSALLQLTRTTANLVSIAFSTLLVTLTMRSDGYQADLSSITRNDNLDVFVSFTNGFSYAFMMAGFAAFIGVLLNSIMKRK